MAGSEYSVSLPLVSLAENDARSFWGLTADGQVYLLGLPEEAKTDSSRLGSSGSGKLNRESELSNPGGKLNWNSTDLEGSITKRSISESSVKDMQHRSKSEIAVKDTRQLNRFKGGLLKLLKVFGNRSKRCTAFAYDGRRFWLLRQAGSKTQQSKLSVFSDTGRHLRSFLNRKEVAISSFSYCHHNLLILDQVHQQLHLYHLADTLETVAALAKRPAVKQGTAMRHRVPGSRG